MAAPPGGVRIGATFRDGFFLESSDGAFRLRLGALVQADGRYFADNSNPAILSNFLLRSVRPELEGAVWDVIEFKLTPDFGQGRVQVQDAYADIVFARALRLRGGKTKVPFSLERLVPEGRTAFLERGFPTQVSANRDIGAMVSGDIARGTFLYGVGIFNGVVDNSTLDLETDGDKEVAGRILLHPFRRTSRPALHHIAIGGGASYGNVRGTVAAPSLDTYQTDGLNAFFRYGAGTAAADTTMAAGSRIRATANAYAYVWRFGFLAEYTWNEQQIRRGAVEARVPVQAWQGYLTFLLTDDEAAYAGVKPRRPFNVTAGRRGAGAFEIGLRASGISVDAIVFASRFADPTKSARSAISYTAGLNWYLNANAKLQLNYVRTDFSGAPPTIANRPSENLMMARLQISL